MDKNKITSHRAFLKDTLRLQIDFRQTDQSLGKEPPSIQIGQAFVATAPVTFVWTVIPYRMEWRYCIAAHRVIAMDVGHVCQNLYLACETIGAGTCAVAA